MKLALFALLAVTVTCSLIVSACGDSCDQLGRPASPAIVISVWDVSTGDPISTGVTGLAVVGDQPTQLESTGIDNEVWAYGPSGTYDLFLSKDGYFAWFQANVTVSGVKCDINTVYVTAELVPSMD